MSMAVNTLCRTFNYFRYTQVIPCYLNLFNVKSQKLKNCVIPQWIKCNETFCTNVAGVEDTVKTKKKKVFIPRITLLSEKNDMSIVTLEEAQKLANRRDVKLIKIVDFDTRTERPVYKLMNIKDFIEEDNKCKTIAKEEKAKQLKDDKTITVSSKISEHDLAIKIKSMHKMLKKKHGIRVIIAVDNNPEKATEIRDEIVKSCPEYAKVLNKSETAVKFQITLRPIIEKLLNQTDPQTKPEKNTG